MFKTPNLSEIIKEGEIFFEEYDNYSKSLDLPFTIIDPTESILLSEKANKLLKKIHDIKTPKDLNELYVKELKNILNELKILLKSDSDTYIMPPKQIIDRLFVTERHIDEKKEWILKNIETIKEANNLMKTKYSNKHITTPHFGSPHHREKAEDTLLKHIEEQKKLLAKVFNHLPNIDTVLNEYLISVDSIDRSGANRISKAAFINTGSCVYIENGEFKVHQSILLTTLTHEVIGHLLQYITTEKSNLPVYLKDNYSLITSGTRESVTEYFENRVFEKITSLGSLYDEVYERHKLTKILSNYNFYLRLIGIWTLSHSKKDKYKDQITELSKYSIDPQFPTSFLNYRKNDWDPTTSLLLPRVVNELRYILDPVEQILKESDKSKLNIIEKLILEGTWTPSGLIDWVRLNLNIKT